MRTEIIFLNNRQAWGAHSSPIAKAYSRPVIKAGPYTGEILLLPPPLSPFPPMLRQFAGGKTDKGLSVQDVLCLAAQTWGEVLFYNVNLTIYRKCGDYRRIVNLAPWESD